MHFSFGGPVLFQMLTWHSSELIGRLLKSFQKRFPYQSVVSEHNRVTRVTSVGSRDLQCSREMAAVIDDAARRAFLHREVDSDLVYIWEDSGISLAHQYELGQGYRTVRKFAALADGKAEARAAFAANLGLDPAGGAVPQAALAGLITAWQIANETNEKDVQNRAEAKNLGVPRPLTFTDRNALYNAFERVHGRVEDKEAPSADYLSQKMEEIEQGELLASNLDEVGSKEDSLTIAIQSSVDTSGRLRITRERKKSKLPTNSEELRIKLKLEGTMLIMLGSKFRNREWFRDLEPNDFTRYVDWLLGEKVYSLQIPKAQAEGTQPLHPPWTVLLRFEQQVRKEAYKQALRFNRSIKLTLQEAMANSELKEVHFVSPVALAMNQRTTTADAAPSGVHVLGGEENLPNKFAKKGTKGKGKGKNGRFDKRYGFIHSQTPDGRQICYGFQEGKCKGNCGRVHICQLCLSNHALKDCKFKLKNPKEGDKKNPE